MLCGACVLGRLVRKRRIFAFRVRRTDYTVHVVLGAWRENEEIGWHKNFRKSQVQKLSVKNVLPCADWWAVTCMYCIIHSLQPLHVIVPWKQHKCELCSCRVEVFLLCLCGDCSLGFAGLADCATCGHRPACDSAFGISGCFTVYGHFPHFAVWGRFSAQHCFTYNSIIQSHHHSHTPPTPVVIYSASVIFVFRYTSSLHIVFIYIHSLHIYVFSYSLCLYVFS